MSLNPITQLEKLINEHGSATILRDHVALLRDKFAFLEKENSTLAMEIEASKKKNAALKAKIAVLDKDVASLRKENEALRKEKQTQKQHGVAGHAPQKVLHGPRLNDPQVRLLMSLFAKDGQTIQELMAAAGLHEQKALYYLGELEQECMVIEDGMFWYLDHEGRGYLIENELA